MFHQQIETFPSEYENNYTPVLVTFVLRASRSTFLLKLLLLILQNLLELFVLQHSTEIKCLFPLVLKPFQGMDGNHLNSHMSQVPFIVSGEKLAFLQHDSSGLF